MSFRLQPPDMVHEASRVQKGYNPFMECLLFVGIFFITQVFLSLLSVIPMMGFGIYIAFTEDAGAPAMAPAALMKELNTVSMICMLYGELAAIFLVLGLCRWFQKRKAWTLGFKNEHILKEYSIGMGLGFLMMTLVVLAAWITGALKLSVNPELGTMRSNIMLLILFVGFLFQGMFEEVLCRGYFLISLARRKGNMWMAILVSALFFSAMHLGNAGISPLAFLNLTLFGIFAGIYFVKRGNLWGVGALHSIWNFTQGNIWGVLVSGIDLDVSLFTARIDDSMSLLNGGSFGPEGGLLVSMVLIAGSLILLKLPQKDAAPAAGIASCDLCGEENLETVREAAPSQPQEFTQAEEFSGAPDSDSDTGEADE